jgi:hypothetical protein
MYAWRSLGRCALARRGGRRTTLGKLGLTGSVVGDGSKLDAEVVQGTVEAASGPSTILHLLAGAMSHPSLSPLAAAASGWENPRCLKGDDAATG